MKRNLIQFVPWVATVTTWLILFTAFCLLPHGNIQAQNVFHLYQSTEQEKSVSGETDSTVNINSLVYSLCEDNVGDILAVKNISDSIDYFMIDKVSYYENGTLTIRGRCEEGGSNYLLLAITEGRLLGEVQKGTKTDSYRIVQRSKEKKAIVKQSPSKSEELPGAPSLIAGQTIEPDESYLQRIKESTEKNERNQAIIDLMIVYTPAAKAWADYYEGSIYNTIAMALEKAQLALDISEVLIDLNIVNIQPIDYVESGSPETDLYNLTVSNGIMDEVHLWRNQYGADLVTLFSFENLVGGIAWQLDNQYGRPDYGFSLIRIQQASWTYTMIHELGHCMGAGHHAEQNFQPGPTSWTN